MIETKLIPAVRIEIPFMEGRAEWSNKEFLSDSEQTCWDKFQDYMKTIANTYNLDCLLNKREWLGYLKTDFVVVFADEEKYEGRYDLQSNGLDGSETLAQHIRNFCLVYSGQKRPNHFTDEQWETFKKNYENCSTTYGKFLDSYEIPA